MILIGYLVLILLLLFLPFAYLPAGEAKTAPQKINLIGFLDNLTPLPEIEKRGEEKRRIFKDLEEAEECLRLLLRERDILVGDFYGINLRNYRYVNIFHPLGYISSRIAKIDKEIKEIKSKIDSLKKVKEEAG